MGDRRFRCFAVRQARRCFQRRRRRCGRRCGGLATPVDFTLDHRGPRFHTRRFDAHDLRAAHRCSGHRRRRDDRRRRRCRRHRSGGRRRRGGAACRCFARDPAAGAARSDGRCVDARLGRDGGGRCRRCGPDAVGRCRHRWQRCGWHRVVGRLCGGLRRWRCGPAQRRRIRHVRCVRRFDQIECRGRNMRARLEDARTATFQDRQRRLHRAQLRPPDQMAEKSQAGRIAMGIRAHACTRSR